MSTTCRRLSPLPWIGFALLILAVIIAPVDADNWDQSGFYSSDASTSTSGSGSDASDTIEFPSDASGFGDGSASSYMATIQFINSHVPPDAINELVREAHEAQQVQADADSIAESSLSSSGSNDVESGTPSASSSSSRDGSSIVFPPEPTIPTPSPSPAPTPTPSATADAGSTDAFKVRVIVLGVVVTLVVLAMVVCVLAAWIRNPGRRRRSTSASIESLVMSPLDRNSSGILGPSSISSNVHNSPHYFVYDTTLT